MQRAVTRYSDRASQVSKTEQYDSHNQITFSTANPMRPRVLTSDLCVKAHWNHLLELLRDKEGGKPPSSG